MRIVRSVVMSILGIALTLTILFVGYQLWNTDTEYAAGYSRKLFESIKAGMSKDEVLTILGTPLDTNSHPDGEVWFYSRQGVNKRANYWERALVFSATGKVSEVHKGFYID